MDPQTLVITVVDPEGQPCAGARVVWKATRLKERPDQIELTGPANARGLMTVTNAAGVATIRYWGHNRDNLTTLALIIRVAHTGACTADFELNVDAPQTITLARGTRVRISAQAPPEIGFSELFADIEPDDWEETMRTWRSEPDYLFVSSLLPDGEHLVRLVGVTMDQRVFFSAPEAFSITPSDHGAVKELVLTLHEARTVKGTLDPAVPRPVMGGWVMTHIASTGDREKAGALLENRWTAAADIHADGSFVVPDLPEGKMEIIAGCDGYVSTDLSEVSIVGVRRAQIMPDDQDGPCVLPMERTGTARIVVLQPDRQPISNASVIMGPRQWLGGWISAMETQLNALDLLRFRQTRFGGNFLESRDKRSRFWGMTDATGAVVFHGVPSGIHFFFTNPSTFQLPIVEAHGPLLPGQNRAPDNRLGRIAVQSGQETTLEVRLEHQGSTSLATA